MIRVLPLNPDQYEFAGKGKRSHMTEFQPSVKAVLDRLAPNYIKGTCLWCDGRIIFQ